LKSLYTLGPLGYPVTVNILLLVVRLFLGPMIFAHGYRKFFGGGKIAGTAGWFDSIGIKPGKLHAYAAASTEVAVGILMTVGLLVPFAAAGLIALMIVAIITVHRNNGFFNFNKGQGVEYNVGIAVMALVPATFGAGRYSLDNIWLDRGWSFLTGLLIALIVGVIAAVLQLAIFYRPPKQG
jgi:putative oxidoreductase